MGSGHQPVDGSDRSVFLIALSKQVWERKVDKLGELGAERFGDPIGDGVEVPMGAAERFRNDVVYNMEVDQIFRRYL